MNRLFLLLFGALSVVAPAQAQVPDYVPTEGLVAWYPFNGNANDESGNGNDGEVIGATAHEDRFGNASSALSFTNATDWVNVPAISTGSEYTIQSWALFPLPSAADGHNTFVSDWNPGSEADLMFMTFHGTCGLAIGDQYAPGNCVQGIYGTELMASEIENGWHLITAVVSGGQTNFYLDGMLLDTIDHTISGTIEAIGNNTTDQGVAPQNAGTLDDVGIWNRALTEEEISTLYNAAPATPGCTDPTACNFAATATSDDGSCLFIEDEEWPEEIWSCNDALEFSVPDSYTNVQWSTGETAPYILVSESGPLSVVATTGTINHIYQGSEAIDISGSSTVTSGASFSVSFDLKLDDLPLDDAGDPNYYIINQGPGGQWGIMWDEAAQNLHFAVKSNTWHVVTAQVSPGEWMHVLCVYSQESSQVEMWIDGVLVNTNDAPGTLNSYSGYPGLKVNRDSNWAFELDNLHVLNYAADGTTFESRCAFSVGESSLLFYNFDGLENGLLVDLSGNGWDASVSTEFPATEWFNGICSPQGGCAFTASSIIHLLDCSMIDGIESTCGPGTVWDVTLQACVGFNDCPSDLDGDGVIGVNDLMQLLSTFGTDCPEAGDPSGDPETAEFNCGDPVTYHGYDYATVQIGEQCWFAENLRAELYRNGDAIELIEGHPAWQQTSTGGYAYYNFNESNMTEYGGLYNWYACTDPRAICPTNWSVPNSTDFQTLSAYVGFEASHLKSTTHWTGEPNLNTTGFGALPAGWRGGGSSSFFGLGTQTEYWTVSEASSAGISYRLRNNTNNIIEDDEPKTQGVSVRCIMN